MALAARLVGARGGVHHATIAARKGAGRSFAPHSAGRRAERDTHVHQMVTKTWLTRLGWLVESMPERRRSSGAICRSVKENYFHSKI